MTDALPKIGFGSGMTRQELDALADRLAARFDLDPENVGVDYERSTVEVDAAILSVLLAASA